MKNLYLISLLLIVQLFIYSHAYAQVPSEADARKELAQKGVSEDELKAALLKKGIDLDKVDPTNLKELQRIEGTVRETVDELAKKKGSSSALPAKSSTDTTVQPPANMEAKAELPVFSTKADPVAPPSKVTSDEKVVIKTPGNAIYGQSLFKGSNLKIYSKVEDARASEAYVLGPGDVVSVSIWGASILNTRQEIGKEGYIQPAGMRRITLTGLKVSEAEQLLKGIYKQRAVFNEQDFAFTVVSARAINVNIFGEVDINGTFNISALNTAFNALIAAGGPSDIGSVRNIKLNRPGMKPKTLDVYEFLKNPIIANEFYLQENDFIHVPVAEKVVTIKGEINRPQNYELVKDEGLTALINFAGGLKNNASVANVQIKRIENDKERIIDYDYRSKVDMPLLKGDEVTILTIAEMVENTVSVQGDVFYPQGFALTKDSKLVDVLTKAKVRETAALDLVYIRRLNADNKTIRYIIVDGGEAMKNPNGNQNITLAKGDVVTIKSQEDFVFKGEAEIAGAVNNPQTFSINENSSLSLQDMIYLSGGLKENATNFGYLVTVNPKNVNDGSYKYIDLTNESMLKEKVLTGQQLMIYTKEEYSDIFTVSIEGAVRTPKVLTYHPSLTLKDLIILAGGLKMEAAPNKIEVFRQSFSLNNASKTIIASVDLKSANAFDTDLNFELKPYDVIIVRTTPEFSFQKFIQVSGEVKYPGKYATLSKSPTIAEIIKQAGGITDKAYLEGATLFRGKDNVGFIVTDFEKAISENGKAEGIYVEEGDIINIPILNSLVSITGAVNFSEMYPDDLSAGGRINLGFVGEKSAKFYIDNFGGGFLEDADRSKVTVRHQNGKISKTKRFLFFRSYPKVTEGSLVKVPMKVVKVDPNKIKKEDEEIDWGKVLSNSVSQATAILSLILLIRAVN